MNNEKKNIISKKSHISDKEEMDDVYWSDQSAESRLNELHRLRLLIGKLNKEFEITCFQKKVHKQLIFDQDV